MHKFSKKNS